MLISELILKLEETKNKKGDLKITEGLIMLDLNRIVGDGIIKIYENRIDFLNLYPDCEEE